MPGPGHPSALAGGRAGRQPRGVVWVVVSSQQQREVMRSRSEMEVVPEASVAAGAAQTLVTLVPLPQLTVHVDSDGAAAASPLGVPCQGVGHPPCEHPWTVLVLQ